MRIATLIVGLSAVLYSAGCQNASGVKAEGVSASDVQEIGTAKELERRRSEGEILLVHALDEQNYAEGHIPGAVNVDYEKMTPAMLPKDKSRSLVFYCAGGRCPVGRLAAARAAKWGYRNVAVYTGGMQDWRASGKDVSRGQ